VTLLTLQKVAAKKEQDLAMLKHHHVQALQVTEQQAFA
jgi:hypothetical protein